jgi:hypothetical protein
MTEHFDIYFSKAKLHSQNHTVLELTCLLGTFSCSSCPTLSASPRNHPQAAARPRRSEVPV